MKNSQNATIHKKTLIGTFNFHLISSILKQWFNKETEIILVYLVKSSAILKIFSRPWVAQPFFHIITSYLPLSSAWKNPDTHILEERDINFAIVNELKMIKTQQ